MFPIPSGRRGRLRLRFSATYVRGLARSSRSGRTAPDLRQLTDGRGIEQHPPGRPTAHASPTACGRTATDSIVVMDAGGGDPITLATTRRPAGFCIGRWNLAWSPDGRVSSSRPATAARWLRPLHRGGRRLVAGDAAARTGDEQPVYGSGLRTGHGSHSWAARTVAASACTWPRWPRGRPRGRAPRATMGPELGPNLADLAATVGDIQAPLVTRWDGAGRDRRHRVLPRRPEGIFVVEADGSGRAPARRGGGQPAWSPDGRELAFHRTVDPSEYLNGRPCTVRTWVIDADGTTSASSTARDGCESPRWSPDGTRLAVLHRLDTGGARADFHLGFVRSSASEPAWSFPTWLGASWQPVKAPLPPAPTFPSAEPS